MFDFSDYYGVADALVASDEEAYTRSGISRYYYSGFGSDRTYLVECMGELKFLDGNHIHKKVCERLMNSKDDTESSIGEKLDDLKKIRNSADYDWNLGIDYFQEHLPIVQKYSMEIIEQVNALKSSPPFLV